PGTREAARSGGATGGILQTAEFVQDGLGRNGSVETASGQCRGDTQGLDGHAPRGDGVVDHDRDANPNDGRGKCNEDLESGTQPSAQKTRAPFHFEVLVFGFDG